MWDHTKPYRLMVFATIGFIVIAKVLDTIVPIYYKQFFDILSGEVITESLRDGLIKTILVILLFHAISWLCWRLMAILYIHYLSHLYTDIVTNAHAYLQKHSFKFFSDNFAGSLVRKVNRLARSMIDLLDQVNYTFVPVTITIVGSVWVLWSRSPVLGLIILAWSLSYLIFNVWFAAWKTKYDFKKAKLDSKGTGVLADAITNAITIKLFTGLEHEKKRYKDVLDDYRNARVLAWGLGEGMDAIQAFLMIAIEFILFYVAIGMYQEGLLTIGDFALIQAYVVGLLWVLWDIGRAVRRTWESFADADEMVEILNTPHGVKDRRGAKQLDVQTGKIEFKDVYFSFNKTRRILKGLNLTIKAKEKVALVGPSGAGKSTITKLLFRFYDIERGKIIIGNQEIAKVNQDSLRENLALVPQEPILFHRTIIDNIRYGRRDATDEEVIEAAKKAHAHEFIKELPKGYENFVGERGVKLSGGERQRVAIARAILKNAPILVLDEATSSLDSESEALIQDALNELMKDKTTIVIAHRLSTIMMMDRIIVVEDGQVTDTGTHKQLLRKKGGIYKKLWDIQAGGFM